MKKLILFGSILITLSISVFALEKNLYRTSSPKKQPETFGFEKGQRKNCVPGSKKICCDSKVCMVTPLSKRFDEEGGMDQVIKPDYFEASIEVINNYQLKLFIPFCKIIPSTYTNWFYNDILTTEYFPLDEEVSNKLGLTNVALSAGQNQVITSNNGFFVILKYQTQTGE